MNTEGYLTNGISCFTISNSNDYYFYQSLLFDMMSRKTKQKEAVSRVLKETGCHPTAEWVYEQVRREIPKISLGTVYRNLKVLNSEGEVSKLELSANLTRYDGNTQNHYHFRCERCDYILDVDQPVNKEIDKKLAQQTGFKVSYHRLEFLGLCKDCQSRDSLKQQ